MLCDIRHLHPIIQHQPRESLAFRHVSAAAAITSVSRYIKNGVQYAKKTLYHQCILAWHVGMVSSDYVNMKKPDSAACTTAAAAVRCTGPLLSYTKAQRDGAEIKARQPMQQICQNTPEEFRRQLSDTTRTQLVNTGAAC